MTLFTFNTNLNKLTDESKLHSLRWNADYWIYRLEKNPKLDVWWLNPRNKNPDCHKLGIAFGTATPLYGHELTLATAKDDGYDSLYDLLNVLMKLHNIECEEVLEHRWAAIRWSWVERYWIDYTTFNTSVQTTL
jgi:hypothetical protein